MFEKFKRLLIKLRAVCGTFGIVASIIGLICIILLAILNKHYNTSAAGYLTVFVYIFAIASSFIILNFLKHENENNENNDSEDGDNLTKGIVPKMDIPILICDENGRILWSNNAFQDIIGETNTALREKALTSLITYQTDVITNADKNPNGVDASIGNRKFKVKGFKTYSYSKNGEKTVRLALAWYDLSEINRIREKMISQRALVANIMIDNIDDIIQQTDSNYREIVTDVDNKLNEWAKSVGAILKEYQRDRYIMIFEAKYLADFVENKFSILEKIRETTVGEYKTPVTVSIGISDDSDEKDEQDEQGRQKTLEEKMKSATEYLEVALQRGGDQVAVKINGQLTFFGGITKNVQKITKTRARVAAGKLLSYIGAAENILIMGHKNADYDSFGACMAAAKISLWKKVPTKIIIRETDPNITKCLIRAKKIPDYTDIFIDGNSAQNLINSKTLLIVVDVNNYIQFESQEVYDNSPKTIFIDHHRLARKFSEEDEPVLTFIDPSASSACEIFSEFLEELLPDNMLSSDEADLIYAGIAVDTKKFTVNAGAKTFSAAMYLRKCGADPMRVSQTLFATDKNEVMGIANFQNDMTIYRDIAAIAINQRTDLTPGDEKYAAMAADSLLTLDGVSASFTLCIINDEVKIKARSNGTLNVQLVIEQLGGGGHFDQAACAIKGATARQACDQLKIAIDRVLDSVKQINPDN